MVKALEVLSAERTSRCPGILPLAALAALALTTPVGAVDYTIGIGPAVIPDYLGSDDYVLAPQLALSARNLYHPDTYIRLLGNRIESNLLAHPNWRLGLEADYNFGRPAPWDVDDQQVDAMDDVDGSFRIGLIGGYDFDPDPRSDLLLSIDAMQSLDDDLGAVIRGQAIFARPLNEAIRYSIGLETSYGDHDYMGSFFGVSGSDAQRSGLDQFDADEGFYSVALNLGGSYRFTESWSMGVGLRYERLLEDAADSPVVDDRGNENQFYGFTTVNYHF